MARNRGKWFEEWIDKANDYYNANKLAVIYKIPTPWKVIRKYSLYDKTHKIVSAFPEKKSTVDFGGTASKLSIWFEAKATNQKHSFPLKNIHEHQMEYLKSVHEQGGKAFFLICSEELNRVWLLWIDDFLGFVESNTRKSIPFTWLDEHCAVIQPNSVIPLDYLPEVLKQRKG